MCALFGSSIWVITASKYGLPVSITHSIVGAVAGFGIAQFGWGALNMESLTKILISWVASPGLSGVIGASIYLITKYAVMNHKNSLNRAIWAIPFYFMFALFISSFYLVLKAPRGLDITKKKFQNRETYIKVAAITGGIGFGSGLLCWVLLVPYFRRLLIDEEDLKWYHAFYTPFVPRQPKSENLNKVLALGADHSGIPQDEKDVEAGKPKSLFGKAKALLFHGVTIDVASAQSDHVREVHSKAVKFDNKTEYVFSFLQVCTAAFASFAHGSNDVANAAGPLSGIISIYETGKTPGKDTTVPVYLLVAMGLAIDMGLVFYGYNVMRNLGNNITYHSPSRGFSMELGAALTVITASFFGIPVSTTHCITGATVAVGLCNGEVRSINWKIVIWALLSWIVTLPFAGGMSAALFLLTSRAPKA